MSKKDREISASRVTRPSRLPPHDREVLYGRPPDFIRTFISSRMNQTLDEERRTALETVNGFPHRRAWMWEKDAPAGVYHSEDECVMIAASSDELILILGEELSRVTRAEYEAARAAGAQCYIMVRDTDEQDAEVEAFIKEARLDAVTRGFNNIAELRSHLFNSLAQASVRASREQHLSRQRRIELGPVEP
jgi:hypothetical protein